MRHLQTLRLHYNNFGCPQPHYLPSVTTVENFPYMDRNATEGKCILYANQMSLANAPWGNICGESIQDYNNQTVCSYLSSLWPNTTRPDAPEFTLSPPSHHAVVHVSGMRHVIYTKYPNGTLYTKYARISSTQTASTTLTPLPLVTSCRSHFIVDMPSITVYSVARRIRSEFYTVYPLERYFQSESRNVSDGQEYTLSATFNQGASSFKTIWLFRNDGDVKFSFVISNFTFAPRPDGQSSLMSVNMQALAKETFLDIQNPFLCRLGTLTNDQGIVYINKQFVRFPSPTKFMYFPSANNHFVSRVLARATL
jgi:hypothetical protein